MTKLKLQARGGAVIVHITTFLDFVGTTQKNCRIYGSLDCDQNDRHPDTAADTCKDYTTEHNNYYKHYSQTKSKYSQQRLQMKLDEILKQLRRTYNGKSNL